MGIVIVDSLTKEDVLKAREDYRNYIKITIDLEKKLLAMGGEYHADAEAVLVERYHSRSSSIWGGGYDLTSGIFETNALINTKPGINDSLEIINPKIRGEFLIFAKEKLAGIETLI